MSKRSEAAYPVAAEYTQNGDNLMHPERGLTKREVAAIAAMQGLLASGSAAKLPNRTMQESVAARAIQFADALLYELRGTEDQP